MELSPRLLLLAACRALSQAVLLALSGHWAAITAPLAAGLPVYASPLPMEVCRGLTQLQDKAGLMLTENVSLRAVLASKKKGTASPSISKASSLSCPGLQGMSGCRVLLL